MSYYSGLEDMFDDAREMFPDFIKSYAKKLAKGKIPIEKHKSKMPLLQGVGQALDFTEEEVKMNFAEALMDEIKKLIDGGAN